MKAAAIAGPNIALVKYWGKRDEALRLPLTGSIGITLDELFVRMEIEFHPSYAADRLWINGMRLAADSDEHQRITRFLDTLRSLAAQPYSAAVCSTSNFPRGAGLASSSAAFAALATAGAAALSLQLSRRELSALARRGSGSACRSVVDGFVEWEPEGDSSAESIASPDHWPELRILSVVTDCSAKSMPSRAGMAAAQATSPVFSSWLESVPGDLATARSAIRQRNLAFLGEMTERNCLFMHTTTMTASPPFLYWNAGTMEVMDCVRRLRMNDGISCYFTIDAGPQVKVLCSESDTPLLLQTFQAIPAVRAVYCSKPGKGSRLVDA